MFFRQKRGKEFVEFSAGKVYLFELTNGMVNKARNKSSLKNVVVNNNVYLMTIEKCLTGFNRFQLSHLSIEDGLKLRKKTIEILERYGILKKTESIVVESNKEDDKANIFSREDVQWFKEAERAGIEKLKQSMVKKKTGVE